MKNVYSRLLALPIAIGWTFGILFYTAGTGWWLPAVATACATALFTARKHYISFGFYAVTAGWVLAQLAMPPEVPAALFDGAEREYKGTVTANSVRPGGQTLIIRLDSVETGGRFTAVSSFKVRCTTLPDWSIYVGERLKFKTVIEPLDAYDDFPYDFDMTTTYLREGVSAQAFLSDRDIKADGTEKSFAWWMYQKRDRVLHLLSHSGLSDEAYALISAITVGYSDELDGTLKANFRAAGLAHTLALSGMHAGIIVMLVSIALFPMRASYRLRKWRLGASLLLIWFYAAMVGFPDSVVRAVIMLSIMIAGKITAKESNPLNSLCTAVIIILAVKPFSIFSTGFQLSVCAVLGIIAFQKRLNPFEPQKWLRFKLTDLITLPVSAVAGTMIIIIARFHRFPVLFLFSNLIMSLLLPPLMLGGIGVIIFQSAGAEASWLCEILNSLVRVTESIVDFFANTGYSELTSIFLNDFQILILSLTLLITALAVNFPSRLRSWTAGAMTAGCILAILLIDTEAPDNECFIMRQSGNTPIVMRQGNRIDALFTCHPRHFENAKERFLQRITAYAEARKADSINIHLSDFDAGAISLRNNVLKINGTTIGLATGPGKPDSITEKVDYALVSSRFRGEIAEVERFLHPDTIILSRDLSIRTAERHIRNATLPVINLRPTLPARASHR